MKILGTGGLYHACTSCGVELFIEQSDIIENDAYMDMPDFHAKCCRCSVIIPIKLSEMPKNWQLDIGGPEL